jgi:DNA polymerase sigma
MVATGQIDPMENISVLLLDFLLLYGIHFSMECVGIDIRGEGCYFYKVHTNHYN